MAEHVRVSSAAAYVKLEADTEQSNVTQVAAYVKIRPYVDDVRVTQALAYVKVYQPWPRCIATGHYTYNGTDITDYLTQLSLANLPRDLAAGRLSDTGQRHTIGLSDFEVEIEGFWNATVDGLLGVDARAGTQRTGVASFDDCTMVVSYTWSAVFVTRWQVGQAAGGKQLFSATLRHVGLGVRSVAAS